MKIMKYNGKELVEMTPNKWDGRARVMLVWTAQDTKPLTRRVIGYNPVLNRWVTVEDTDGWTFCAEIPQSEPITDERIKILNAYKAGKRIECRFKDRTMRDSWSYIETPAWNWDVYDYRVGKISKDITNNQSKKKFRIMTYCELAEWLAKGNGICAIRDDDMDYPVAYTHLNFMMDEANDELPDCYRIRGWHESELREPLIEE